MTNDARKELYTGYVKEAVANLKQQDLLKSHMKDIKDAVKESEFDVQEFTNAVQAAYDMSKIQDKVDKLQRAIDTVEELGV